MMDFFRKHKKNIFIITVAVFVGGMFVGFGGYAFKSMDSDTVAVINGVKIPRRKFDFVFNRHLEALRKDGKDVSSDAVKQAESEAIQSIIQDEVFWQEAKKFGIKVTDGELAADIRRFPAFQRDGVFHPGVYYDFLRRILRTTPSEFEEFRRQQIAFMKLRYFIYTSIYVTEEEAREEYKTRFPDKLKDWDKEKSNYIQTYRQEVVNNVFNEYLRQLNSTVKIKVLYKGSQQRNG